ncbi:MAG: maleylpyruvate isomerase N-terminal domain-containing protein [Nocardioides sp.]
MTDWAEVYRANVDAVTALASGADAETLAHPVPATPVWTVREVLAHLAGSPADVLSGRMDGAPGADWTARHVAERATLSVDDLLAEIRSHVDPVVATLEGSDRPALVWNLAVHHADLHEALGKGAPPAAMWQPVVEAMDPSLGEHAAAFAGVSDYERFRMFFSRRSRAQTAAWGTGLDQDTLDGFALFGPRDDDQPIPD